MIERFSAAGGTGPKYAQITLCYGPDRDECVTTAHRVWPNSAVPGQLSQDLPTWTHFEQACAIVTPEMVAEQVPCGPDVGAIVESVRRYLEAGYDHLYFHQIGPDQQAFVDLWQRELRDALPG